MVNTVYTIGYSGFSIDDFISTIKEYKISLIIDVRSFPFSNYYPDFNKDTLELNLKNHGIYYRNYAREFGARQDNKKYYCKDGYLDFEVFSKCDSFLSGIGKLSKSMEQNYTFALMCAEKDPITCHRTILISRAFYERGYNVIHLLPNGQITQEVINSRLIEKYYPNRNQMTLFGDIQDEKKLLPLSVSELREAADGQLSMFGVGRPSVMDQLVANRPADKKSPAQTVSRKNHEPEIRDEQNMA